MRTRNTILILVLLWLPIILVLILYKHSADDAPDQNDAVAYIPQERYLSLHAETLPIAEPVLVPSIVGMSEPEAAAAIQAAGLIPGELRYHYSEEVPKGNVLDQFPKAGTAVSEGVYVHRHCSNGTRLPEENPPISSCASQAIHTADGGMFLVGWVRSADRETNACLIKLANNGKKEWSTVFQLPDRNVCYAIEPARENGYWIAGKVSKQDKSKTSAAYLIRIDAEGNELWSKQYPGFYRNAGIHMATAREGGCYLAGVAALQDDGEENILLLKVDASGNVLWRRRYGSSGKDAATPMLVLDTGELLLTGHTAFPGNRSGDFFFLKFSPEGEKLAENSYVLPNRDYLVGILPAEDDTYMMLSAESRWIKVDGEGKELDRGQAGKFDYVENSIDAFHAADDSSYYLAGHNRRDDRNHQAVLAKMDTMGNLLWQCELGSQNAEHACDILPGDTGCALITIQHPPYNTYSKHIAILQTDLVGNLRRTACYDGGFWHTRSVPMKLDDGQALVYGSAFSDGEDHLDFCVAALDSTGAMRWWKRFGADLHERPTCCRVTETGAIFVGGVVGESLEGDHNPTGDLSIAKLSPTGDMLWQKDLDLSDNEESLQDIYPTEEGGCILAGYTVNRNHIHQGFLVKIDEKGRELWRRRYGQDKPNYKRSNRINAVRTTNDGGYVIAGKYGKEFSKISPFFVGKTDKRGTLLWQRTIGTNQYDQAQALTLLQDGSVIAVGTLQTERYGNLEDIYTKALIVRVDPMGEVLWDLRIGNEVKDHTYNIAKDIVPVGEDTFLVELYGSFDENPEGRYVLNLDADGNVLWIKPWADVDTTHWPKRMTSSRSYFAE